MKFTDGLEKHNLIYAFSNDEDRREYLLKIIFDNGHSDLLTWDLYSFDDIKKVVNNLYSMGEIVMK